MGWTTPPTESTGYVVTATDWNNYISGNPLFLYGDSGWTNVSVFTNSWASHGAGVVPRFMLIGRVVFMNGQLQSGTSGTAAFTLPVGYRPSQTFSIPANASGSFGTLQVATTGVVTPTGGNTFFDITCSFPVV